MSVERFQHEYEIDRPRAEVHQDLLRYFTPRLANWGYGPTEQSADSFTYTRRYTPTFAIVCAVLLFPIGLLFLMIKNESMIVVNLVETSETATTLMLVGSIPPELQRALQTHPPDAPPPEWRTES